MEVFMLSGHRFLPFFGWIDDSSRPSSMLKYFMWFLVTAFAVPLSFKGLLFVVHKPEISAILVVMASAALYMGFNDGKGNFHFSHLHPWGVLWRGIFLVLAAMFLSSPFLLFGKFPFIQMMLIISAFTSALGIDWEIRRDEIANIGLFAMGIQIAIVLLVFSAIPR